MFRILIMIIVALGNFILQSSAFQYIAIGGIKPNTMIIIIVSYAILRGDVEGSVLGFFMGLIQDMFFGQVLGFFALIGALIGFVCGKPFKDFFPENYLLPVVLVFFSVIVYEFIFYVTHFLLLGATDFSYYFKLIILPETIYTTALTLVGYRIIYGINRRIDNFEQKRRGFFG